MNEIKINSTTLNVLRVYATALVFFCHSTLIAEECFDYHLYGVLHIINTPAWGGVWIFLVMGGFLAAYGFDQQKYTISKAGIKDYYMGRLVKVLVPTWIFLSLMYIFNMQEAQVNITTVLRWITCTFNGPGAGIKRVGASWYVFVIMWLYLLTPILLNQIYKFENRYKGRMIIFYCLCIVAICGLGIFFRAGGVIWNRLYDDQFYYNWCYANVTGTIDMFLIGMIGERMMRYLPEIHNSKIRKYRKCALWTLIITTCIFLGNVKYQTTIYKIVGPSLFSLSTILVIIAYSYKCNDRNTQATDTKLIAICNLVAPYAFMFYLWHSPVLGFVAEKVKIQDSNLHYLAMLIIGGFITIYVAFLMTKMNNGIIKTIIK